MELQLSEGIQLPVFQDTTHIKRSHALLPGKIMLVDPAAKKLGAKAHALLQGSAYFIEFPSCPSLALGGLGHRATKRMNAPAIIHRRCPRERCSGGVSDGTWHGLPIQSLGRS